MEKGFVTLQDIGQALYTAKVKESFNASEPFGKEVYEKSLRQDVYVARTRAREQAGAYWQAREKLSDLFPVQYDSEHTGAIFDELTDLVANEPQGLYLRKLGISPQTIDSAEQLLFEFAAQTIPINTIEFPYSGKDEDDRTPEIIRGHHLGHANAALRDLNRYNESMTRMYRELQDEIRNNPDKFTPEAKNYIADTPGMTEESLSDHMSGHVEGYRRLIAREDDYPVAILPGVKDNICVSCNIGNHCVRDSHDFRPAGMLERDYNVLYTFVNEAVRLRLANDFSIVRQTINLIDVGELEVEGIRTTAGNVKNILSRSTVNWFWIHPKIREQYYVQP